MQDQANIAVDIDELPFPELDDLRHRLRVPQYKVCQDAGLDPATYTRWVKWSRGEPGGSRPHPRSLKALRDALREKIQKQGQSAPA